jgi:hypothetical protein
MRLNLVNRKTGKSDQIDFKNIPLERIKQIACTAAASASKHFICVIADSEEDIDFVATNFHNLPVPSTSVEQAIWTGDLAIFIMLNYPAREHKASIAA